MLEAPGIPINRKPLVPVRGVTERKERYIVPKGSSKVQGEIHVSYTDFAERANGDTFVERETVHLCFEYPKGRTNKSIEFRADNRDYANIHTVYQGQEDVPADVLEVLVGALPLEVRRILPALPRKK